MARGKRFADGILVFSLILIAAGSGLLLRTTGAVETAELIVPLALIFGGIGVLTYAFLKSLYARTIASGTFMALSGCILLLGDAYSWELMDYWPLFLVAMGMAVFIAGICKWKGLRPGFSVTAIVFSLLGGLFSIFSFGSVRFSFRVFLREWWPSFFLVAGLTLLSLYFWNRKRFGPRK